MAVMMMFEFMNNILWWYCCLQYLVITQVSGKCVSWLDHLGLDRQGGQPSVLFSAKGMKELNPIASKCKLKLLRKERTKCMLLFKAPQLWWLFCWKLLLVDWLLGHFVVNVFFYRYCSWLSHKASNVWLWLFIRLERSLSII